MGRTEGAKGEDVAASVSLFIEWVFGLCGDACCEVRWFRVGENELDVFSCPAGGVVVVHVARKHGTGGIPCFSMS